MSRVSWRWRSRQHSSARSLSPSATQVEHGCHRLEDRWLTSLPVFPFSLCCRAIQRIRGETQGGTLHYMHVDLASLK